eukprot:CAMPEP_0198330790 /NCGR_PEP_ID=MMETSP1450-20131203/17170_1 /TAXON_ID=753684 ORGANISM="Madagascaria erythrocladiodes, Strain CCMP3234" /NCGR_SAMPLE_ID=MMETSP1450 /ASSEMBLY_ACC=CAM_ASM_001115 /LENGTH=207 /DNA_ID=CAMNT_0044035117 /DNA_START=70 /DNA_END=693 /DNA_ORIENTATION=+
MAAPFIAIMFAYACLVGMATAWTWFPQIPSYAIIVAAVVLTFLILLADWCLRPALLVRRGGAPTAYRYIDGISFLAMLAAATYCGYAIYKMVALRGEDEQSNAYAVQAVAAAIGVFHVYATRVDARDKLNGLVKSGGPPPGQETAEFDSTEDGGEGGRLGKIELESKRDRVGEIVHEFNKDMASISQVSLAIAVSLVLTGLPFPIDV